ncbi:hypothetical protein DOS67_01185, partial [Staphylococcus felis]
SFHACVDRHGFILDSHVTPGNIHDSTQSGPPVKRVVCSWAISPLYQLASKGAGFFISCSSQNAIISLARGWDLGFQFPRKTPQKSFEMIFVVFFI